jgi:hypothetical protein
MIGGFDKGLLKPGFPIKVIKICIHLQQHNPQ